ncbi:Hypothetical_protein [Hexamita inflata]|uniref:Hypothetical_protein n=1 Tax=Hexamita inflata TaxID=28002 RepID=A0AA86NN24_9EUKA|nr:Hypothetical protein HINF_LOCUS10224 [Hexamita inflata]
MDESKSTSNSRIKMFEESGSEQNLVDEMLDQLDNNSLEIPLIEMINFNDLRQKDSHIQNPTEPQPSNQSNQLNDSNEIQEVTEIEMVKKEPQVEPESTSYQVLESSRIPDSSEQQVNEPAQTDVQAAQNNEQINPELENNKENVQIIESSGHESDKPAKGEVLTSSNVSNQQSDIEPKTTSSQKQISKKLNLTNMLNMDFGAYQSKFEQAQKSKVAAPFKITPLIGMGFQPATIKKSESVSSIRPYVEQLKEVEDQLKNQINERDHDFDDLLPNVSTTVKNAIKKPVATTTTKTQPSTQNMFTTYMQTGILHCFAHFACEISRLSTSYFQLKYFGVSYFKSFVIYETFLNSFIWSTLVQGQRITTEIYRPRIIEQTLNGLVCSLIMLCFLPLVPKIKEFYPQLIIQILIYPTKKSVQEEIVLCGNKQHILHFSSIIFPQLIRFMIEVNNYLRFEKRKMKFNMPTLIAQSIADILTIIWFFYLHTGKKLFIPFINKVSPFNFKQQMWIEIKLIFKQSLKNYMTIVHTIILGFPFFHLFINARDTDEDFQRLYLFYSSVSISYKTLSPLIFSHNLVLKENKSGRIKSIQVNIFVLIVFAALLIILFNSIHSNNIFIPELYYFPDSIKINTTFGILFGCMIAVTQLMYLKIMWNSEIIWQILYICNQIIAIIIGRIKQKTIKANKIWIANAMSNQCQYTLLMLSVFIIYQIRERKNKKNVKFNDRKFKGLMEDLAILDK